MKRSLSTPLIRLTLLGILLASGCVPTPKRSAPEANAPIFLPPTLAPTVAPTSEFTPTPEGGADQSNCENNLLFTEDITVPRWHAFRAWRKDRQTMAGRKQRHLQLGRTVQPTSGSRRHARR